MMDTTPLVPSLYLKKKKKNKTPTQNKRTPTTRTVLKIRKRKILKNQLSEL